MDRPDVLPTGDRERRGIVVHPGASEAGSVWPPEHLRALVDELARRGRDVTVTGGADERFLTRRVAGDRAVDLGGRTSAAELAELLATAEAVVAGDTGAAHLAVAVGTPVVLVVPTADAVRRRPSGALCEVVPLQEAAVDAAIEALGRLTVPPQPGG